MHGAGAGRTESIVRTLGVLPKAAENLAQGARYLQLRPTDQLGAQGSRASSSRLRVSGG